jgi:hypothetical protein
LLLALLGSAVVGRCSQAGKAGRGTCRGAEVVTTGTGTRWLAEAATDLAAVVADEAEFGCMGLSSEEVWVGVAGEVAVLRAARVVPAEDGVACSSAGSVSNQPSGLRQKGCTC